uniref:UBZ1-type domain-containing protein n=1 Tax=Lepeophtheirus salmonis TaxID=72036 RepID=A0A0K2UM33_LEPSM|nr:uncharacterized protein LOC121113827 [Lepeophtheirus salmonis]
MMSGSSRVRLESTRISLEEKCSAQEKRIEELEKENASLVHSRREVYEEVKDLHAGNIALRERNLKLGRELARLSKENIRLEKDLGSLESGEDWNAIKEELLLQRRLLYNRFLPFIKNSLPHLDRTCPMCEYNFSPSTTSQMEFEAHVIQHFPYENEEVFYDTGHSFSS